LRLPIDSQRPEADRHRFPVNGWLYLEGGHSEIASDWEGFKELIKYFGIAKPRIYHAL